MVVKSSLSLLRTRRGILLTNYKTNLTMSTSTFTPEQYKGIAVEILKQLGGKRFIAFTGAHSFICLDKEDGGLMFLLPEDMKEELGVITEKIIIKYDVLSDTYDFESGHFEGSKYIIESQSSNIYADQLRETFISATGLFIL